MSFTPTETQRLREGLQHRQNKWSTHEWRFYFRYLLGRDVTLAETDAFLRTEAADVQINQPSREIAIA